MDVFSLEDDDVSGLFLTQSSDKSVSQVNDSVILKDPFDFSSPCVSLVSQPKPNDVLYSDISDSEDFNIPSSQIQQEVTG